jgi:hypothetical protein
MADTTHPDNDSSHRRSGPRRISIAPTGADKRDNSDRREGSDRRGYHVNLMISDDQGIQEIFAWLIDKADDTWTIGPNDNEPAESAVTCRVRFANESDMTAFADWVNSL